MTALAAGVAGQVAPLLIECPYKGLPFYADTDEDARLFFGRGAMRKLIVANLKASRLTLLYGPSGVGKSSLLHAGVAHHLRVEAAENLADFGAPGHAVVIFRSWEGDPVKRLTEAVARAARSTLPGRLDEPELGADATLADVLDRWSLTIGGRLLIVLDQFEDYFRHHPDDAAGDGFGLQFQRAVVYSGLQTNFLVGIRDDAYAQLNQFTLVPGLFDNALRLGHLTREGALEAIEGPLEVYRSSASPVGPVRAETALAQTLLGELARGAADGASSPAEDDGTRYEALSLQLVLHRLWQEESRVGSTTMRASTLAKLGGTKTIVRDHLRAALAGLGRRDRDVAAHILLNLATLEGKVAVGEATLAADVAPRSRPRVARVLHRLEDARIVLLDQSGPPRYEILHDSLAREARDWAREHEYGRERRRRSLLLAGTAVVVVAALAVAGTAYWSAALNSRQGRLDHAESKLLAKQADAATDPGGSLDLALQAVGKAREPVALDALLRALLRQRALAVFRGRSPFTTAAFSQDGQRLVTAAADGTVTVWDVHARRRTAVLTGARGAISGVAFSPDGSLVAAGGLDSQVRLWRSSGGPPLATLRGHTGPILSLAFSADGSQLVTGGEDRTARLWRVRNGAPLLVFTGHDEPVTRVALAPDGRTLLTAGADRRAKLWSVPERRRLRNLPLSDGALVDAAFSPGGDLVATADVTGRVRVFRVRDGAPVANVVVPGRLVAVTFSPDGRLVETVGADGTARLWTTSGRPVAVRPGHGIAVARAAFSPDGGLLATVDADGAARLWPLRGASVAVLRGGAGRIIDASFSPGGDLVATASADGTARLWRVATGANVAILRGHRGPVRRARFDGDGRLLLTAGVDGTARVWSVPDGRSIAILRGGGQILDAAWSPDGTRLATAGSDGAARVWSSSGRLVAVLRAPTRPVAPAVAALPAAVLAVAFSPDGRLVATASADGTARVWTVADRTSVVLRGASALSRVDFSPNGRLVLVAGHDGAARLYHSGGGKPVAAFRGDRSPLTAAAFGAGGTLVVTAGAAARVWSTDDPAHPVELPSNSPIRAAAFGPQRWLPLVVTASVDGRLRVWSATGGAALATFDALGSDATTASFSADGGLVVGGFADGTARIYRCEGCDSRSARELVAYARRIAANP